MSDRVVTGETVCSGTQYHTKYSDKVPSSHHQLRGALGNSYKWGTQPFKGFSRALKTESINSKIPISRHYQGWTIVQSKRLPEDGTWSHRVRKTWDPICSMSNISGARLMNFQYKLLSLAPHITGSKDPGKRLPRPISAAALGTMILKMALSTSWSLGGPL